MGYEYADDSEYNNNEVVEEEYDYNYNENDNNEYDNNEYDNNEYEAEEESELYDESTNTMPMENNAWVWQLLILSFSLGVCSCLCYYATKVKPSNSKNGRYDFRHSHRGKYSQVGVQSAYSEHDITENN